MRLCLSFSTDIKVLSLLVTNNFIFISSCLLLESIDIKLNSQYNFRYPSLDNQVFWVNETSDLQMIIQ